MFNVEKGRNPKDLNELVRRSSFPKIPAAPYGMKLEYDAAAGKVKVVTASDASRSSSWILARNTRRSSRAASASATSIRSSCATTRRRGDRRAATPRASSCPAARRACMRRTRRCPTAPSSSSASRCSASATACNSWPSISAAKSSRARSANTAKARSASRTAAARSSPTCRRRLQVWNSHGDKLTKLPGRLQVGGRHGELRLRRHREPRRARCSGLQFHPEVVHTPRGASIIANFVHGICGCGKNWTMHNYIDQAVAGHPRPGRRREGDPRA